MEVYPLLSLVRGWEILTIPGSLVNRRLMVFSLKNQSLFNQFSHRAVPFLPHSCPLRSFARAILPDDRRELESATSPPGCEGDCTSKLSFVHGVPRSVSEYSKIDRFAHNRLRKLSNSSTRCGSQNEFSDRLLEKCQEKSPGTW